MKRMLTLLLSFALLLTSCTQPQFINQDQSLTEQRTSVPAAEIPVDTIVWRDDIPQFDSLDDAALLAYVEDLIYRETVLSLNSEEYFVENVSAVYLSKEYLDEAAFNSRTNIYFGYTMSELDEFFQGTRYIFTLGEDGKTAVRELQEIEDTSAETMLKNVAIGTGVILVCVTVSVVTAGSGAPAVSMIFAASAKTGALMAVSSGGIGAVSAGIVRGIQTSNFEEAMESAAIAGTEGFKWGAISGVISGGAGEAIALKGATCSGLTMNEAALIQKETGFPLDVIKQFQNMEQYKICKDAGLTANMINGKTALIRNIDLDYMDEYGVTNLQRMQAGKAPLDPTGNPYELHHIGKKTDSTLAILTRAEHRQNGNAKIWNQFSGVTEKPSSQAGWTTIREEFWMTMAEVLGGV